MTPRMSADGNALASLRGLQRCDRLEDLRVAGNALTSLQGLRAAAGTLDVRGQGGAVGH